MDSTNLMDMILKFIGMTRQKKTVLAIISVVSVMSLTSILNVYPDKSIASPAESVKFNVSLKVSPLLQVMSNRCAMSKFTDAIAICFEETNRSLMILVWLTLYRNLDAL